MFYIQWGIDIISDGKRSILGLNLDFFLKDSDAAVGSWIAVCYSSFLRYVGWVVSRTNTSISANFLDWCDGGLYQIRKGVETVLKDMVSLNNVDVLPVQAAIDYRMKGPLLKNIKSAGCIYKCKNRYSMYIRLEHCTKVITSLPEIFKEQEILHCMSFRVVNVKKFGQVCFIRY